MYSNAFASIRDTLWHAVHPKTRRVIGQLFLVNERVAITAAHVVVRGELLALLWDGLWSMRLVLEDRERDIAVLVLQRCIEAITERLPKPLSFPEISSSHVSYGESLGILGFLHREDPLTSEPTMRRIITAGIVAFLSPPNRFAVHGAFAEPGFSGGPVFTPDAKLVAVTTGVESTLSQSRLGAPMEFPLISPLFPLRSQILQAMSEHR